jgi:predicted dehydrogenase
MDCLIIGYGSIGARHANILKEMGHSVHVVTKRDVKYFPCYSSIKKALQDKDFDYVIISNETCNHYNSFIELNELGYSGKLLIEKPAFLEPSSLPQADYENVFVAYNLRFHPVIQKLHEFLNGKEIYSIQVYVGQYLPDWRPGADYTRSYSASKAQGGGVLRDLSHELDYINWIAGGWKRVAAIGGKFSDLQIDSDDVFILLLEMENCPVASVQMNYLDRKARREIIINLKDYSIKADLLHSTLEIDEEMTMFEVEKDITYTIQHNAILNGDYSTSCTLKQGIDVLNLIHAAELASKKQAWINRSDLENQPPPVKPVV